MLAQLLGKDGARRQTGVTRLNRQPGEKTPSAYRFEIPLAAGATQEFPVNEERVYDQTYALSSASPDAIFGYIQNRALSDAAKRLMPDPPTEVDQRALARVLDKVADRAGVPAPMIAFLLRQRTRQG